VAAVAAEPVVVEPVELGAEEMVHRIQTVDHKMEELISAAVAAEEDQAEDLVL
jgi:hypothetical protein